MNGFIKLLKQKLFSKFMKISGLINIQKRIKKIIKKDIIKDLYGVV